MGTPVSKVLRDGKIQMVPTISLTVGDIVYLEEGNIVPADIQLLETNSLKIDESALTGESLSITKDANKLSDDSTPLGDRLNFAFTSTIVTYGSGYGVVKSIGMNTEMGKIANLLEQSSNKKELPPLKKKINKLTKVLTGFAFGLLVLLLVANIILYFVE